VTAASDDASAGFRPRDLNRHPKAHTPNYQSSIARSPRHALIAVPPTLGDTTGPLFGHADVGPTDHDLLTNHAAAGQSAIGERIILHGRVLDEDACPVPNTLVEIWQANAGGRYRHRRDSYLAALDPGFGGCGRTLTDADGRYRFHTIRPGAYPWPNVSDEWRPAHVHFSVFGSGFVQRLITQCYFEGDPLVARCPIVATLPDADAVSGVTARLDMNESVAFDSLAWRFDLVLRGRGATPFDNRPEGD